MKGNNLLQEGENQPHTDMGLIYQLILEKEFSRKF